MTSTNYLPTAWLHDPSCAHRSNSTSRLELGQQMRLLCGFHEPNITELNRHSMLLQHQRASRSFSQAMGCAMRQVQLLFVINLHPIEQHGCGRVRRLLAADIKPRGAEIDVESLPLQRRETRTKSGFDLVSAVVKSAVGIARGASVGFVDVH